VSLAQDLCEVSLIAWREFYPSKKNHARVFALLADS